MGILIPAHNEAGTIASLLEDLKKQLPLDQVLVVADNCTDDTATIAHQLGARVTERSNTELRGKGYALAHGVTQWSQNPPEILIFLDADCRIASQFIEQVVAAVTRTKSPVQAEFVMIPHPDGVVGQAISAFAWFVMNSVRQRGLMDLGAPARLNGTGMAMPWGLVQSLHLDTDHLVEDTVMGLELAEAGTPAQFLPDVVVQSYFPSSSDAEISQRQRWEGGQAQILSRHVPKMLMKGLKEKKGLLTLSALDLTIPPLTRFATLFIVAFLIMTVAGLFGASWFPLFLLTLSIVLFGVSLVIAYSLYRQYGQQPASLSDMWAFLKLKAKVLTAGRAKGWVRTSRDDEER
ncbi:MAG: glycosyltransferase [Pseudomonadota bacterium]